MRQNKAARFNRAMMWGTMFLGIILFGCVFFFLYWAGSVQQEKQDTLQSQGDSIVIEMNEGR